MKAEEEQQLADGWSEKRWGQIFDLKDLLNECQTINNGSGIIERLQRIPDIADKFNSDYGAEGSDIFSFDHFLTNLATDPTKNRGE